MRRARTAFNSSLLPGLAVSRMITRMVFPSFLLPIRGSRADGCTRKWFAPGLFAGQRGRLALILAGQLAQHCLEVLGLAEIAVDRGEADIGDVVKAAQAFHHGLADGFGGYLA